MRREGRLHGYEFDRRSEEERRVKTCRHPTNRSKFRPKFPQEKAGRPHYKALKKMKGQRNKAHGADVAANHRMHEWALPTYPPSPPLLLLLHSVDDDDDIDLAPNDQPQPLVFVLGEYPLHARRHRPGGKCAEREILEDEADSDASDWLDLGFIDASDDEWYLC